MSPSPYQLPPCDPQNLTNSDMLCALLDADAQFAPIYMGYTRYVNNNTVIQLYQNIYNLAVWFEIKVSDIIYCQPADDLLTFNGGYLLWLKEGSQVLLHEISDKPKSADKDDDDDHSVKKNDDDRLHREQFTLKDGRLNITILQAATGGRVPPPHPPCRYS